MENPTVAGTKVKACPHCKLSVDPKASRCPHCQGKIYQWTLGRKIIAGLVLFMFVPILIGLATDSGSSSSPAVNAPSEPSVQEVAITESQCADLKAEFYSIIADGPHELKGLAKGLLEQALVEVGVPIKQSTPNVHYALPKSECGELVGTAVWAIAEGQRKAYSE